MALFKCYFNNSTPTPTSEIKVTVVTTNTTGYNAAVKTSKYIDNVLVTEQYMMYQNYTGEANAYECDPVKVFYNSGLYKWQVNAIADCTYNGNTYSSGQIISQWSYNATANVEIIKL